MHLPGAWIALLLGLALAGCDRPAPVSGAARALQEAPPEHVFRGVLEGQPVHLVVHDCEVFRVERDARGELHGTRVLAPEPYPFFTGCERQSLRAEPGAVVAVLGRQALGAGGCCATGGTYRSVDGRRWTKQ